MYLNLQEVNAMSLQLKGAIEDEQKVLTLGDRYQR